MDVIMTRQLEEITSKALEEGVAKGTRKVISTHLGTWGRFCKAVGVDTATIGAVEREREEVTQPDWKRSRYSGHVRGIHCLLSGKEKEMQRAKFSRVRRTDHYLGTIPLRSEEGQKTRLISRRNRRVRLKRVIKGLRKMCPTKRLVRKPILQHHLRSVKQALDLAGNQTHRVAWALWITQWQGVLWSSDLIKRDADKGEPWVPTRETHRGRVTVDVGRDSDGRKTGGRLTLRLKPNKMNQAGETTGENFHRGLQPAGFVGGRGNSANAKQ